MLRTNFVLGAMLVVALFLAGSVPYAAPLESSAADSGQVCSAAEWGVQRRKVGEVLDYQAASPRPLPANWTETVVSPGAEFIRVHFVDMQLEPGDVLTVSSADGAQVWTYTERGPNQDGDFWSFAVDGDTAKIEVQNKSGKSHGYRIDGLGHGTEKLRPGPSPEVVCGTDGRENIACHTNEAVINAAQKPVARLLFTSGGGQYLCTGELVAGSNGSTMITNNHCFSTQTEVNTVQAKFNYQYASCSGGSLATTTDYAGGTFLKTNAERYTKKKASGLDYTLFTLQGNPETTWGELTATTKAPVVGQQINFIQHPGGNPKRIGYWEDEAHTVRCKVDTVNKTYGSAKPNSQVGYGCDSEGGSSGSAITDAGTGRIISLHHYGGVSTNPCLNSGTLMSLICADAGALLSCVSN